MKKTTVFAVAGAALLSAGTLPALFQNQAPILPTVGSPGGPSKALPTSEIGRWLRGRKIFDHNFHKSDGLGTPEMNADSCRACHQDPAIGGAGGLELNVSRFGFDNGGLGPFEDLTGGQGLSKLRPPYVAGREEYSLFDADVFEQRQTPTIFGAGLIDSIPDAEILMRADPNDLDGDGIAGTARMIDVGGGVLEVGKFGWKAQVPTLADFIRDAMGGECGITTPDDGRGFALASDGDNVADPELNQIDFDNLHFFLSHLALPARTGNPDPMVALGESVFETIGCADCHVPVLQGTEGPVPLYSDLLCHQVMPSDFRGMAEPGAGVGIYKTPPLWGIKDTAPYMHDGRSETIFEAIRDHYGEATASRQEFVALPQAEQDALILFLEDL